MMMMTATTTMVMVVVESPKQEAVGFVSSARNSLFSEICGLLGYYAASCGNCLPTFRYYVSVPSSRVSPTRTLDQ
jgi:hypothetical protein